MASGEFDQGVEPAAFAIRRCLAKYRDRADAGDDERTRCAAEDDGPLQCGSVGQGWRYARLDGGRNDDG